MKHEVGVAEFKESPRAMEINSEFDWGWGWGGVGSDKYQIQTGSSVETET